MKKTKTTPLINVVTKLGVADAIDLCISEIGARRVLKTIFAICFRNTLEKSCFPMNLLANKGDEEMANVACALHYIEQNWQQVTDDGLNLLGDKIKQSRKS